VIARVTIALVIAGASAAHAGRVALLTSGEADRAALGVALAGRADVVAMAPPDGALRLDRAAAAQRAAIAAAADAAAWLDAGELCVVSADGAYFRHAPFPADESPRVFAAIATSLLDELLAPPEAGLPPIRVDVHVAVGAPGAMPPAIQTATEVAPSSSRTRARLGVMVSPATAGLEAGIETAIAPRLRLAVIGLASANLTRGDAILGGAIDLRRVGLGARHFDYGVIAGVATATEMPDQVAFGFGALHLDVTWELQRSAIAFSLAGGLAQAIKPDNAFNSINLVDQLAPIVWTSLRWELPL
jgi:hypothetical protein